MPETTTFRPAVDGLGDDAMLRLPGPQGVAQQVPDGQHVVGGQHAVA
jgi:hypothetical protein